MEINQKDNELHLYPVSANEYMGAIRVNARNMCTWSSTTVILDASGSMGGATSRFVQQILPLVMEKLNYPDDYAINLITFDNATNSYSLTKKKLRASGICSGGNTYFGPAINALRVVLRNHEKNNPGVPMRILTISDGIINDPDTAQASAKELVDFVATSTLTINSQAMRLFTSDKQPDTRALSYMLHINNSTATELCDIRVVSSNDAISNEIVKLFRMDCFAKYQTLQFEKAIILKFPWNPQLSFRVILSPGWNIFWLKLSPTGVVKLGNDDVKVNVEKQLTLEMFHELMETKLAYITNHMIILKLVGTSEANGTVDAICEYFKKTEDALANKYSSPNNNIISNLLDGIAKNKTNFRDSAQMAEFLRKSNEQIQIQRENDRIKREKEAEKARIKKREQEKRESERRAAAEEAERRAARKKQEKREAEQRVAEEAQQRAAVEAARKKQEEQEKKEAEQIAAAEAARKKQEEQEKKEAERKAAAESARKKQEEQEKKEAEQKAIEEAERKAAAEAARKKQEEQEKKEAEQRAAAEAARKKQEEQEKKEAERKAAAEAARKKQEEQEKKEAERKAAAEAARKKQEEQEKKEAEQRAAEAERKVAAEAARKKQEEQEKKEAERKAAAESARKKQEEEEKKEAELRASEEAARKKQQEEEKKMEAERLAAEEAERLAAEEAERLVAEEAERLASEEAERRKAEEAKQLAAEEAERTVAEEAARIKQEVEAREAEEAEEARIKREEEARVAEEASAKITEEEIGSEVALIDQEEEEEEAVAADEGRFKRAEEVDRIKRKVEYRIGREEERVRQAEEERLKQELVTTDHKFNPNCELNFQTVFILDEHLSSVEKSRRFTEKIIPLMLSKLFYESSELVHLVTFVRHKTTVEQLCQSLLQTLDARKQIRVAVLTSNVKVQDGHDIENFAETLIRFLSSSNYSFELQVVRLASTKTTTRMYSLVDVNVNDSNDFIAKQIAGYYACDQPANDLHIQDYVGKGGAGNYCYFYFIIFALIFIFLILRYISQFCKIE